MHILTLQKVYVIFPDSPELVLNGGEFEFWTWEDSNGLVVVTFRELTVWDLGNYSLAVSQKIHGVRCENTFLFEVLSCGAPEDFTTTMESFSDQVTIAIDAICAGDFEYSRDREKYQDQALFMVFSEEYTLYVGINCPVVPFLKKSLLWAIKNSLIQMRTIRMIIGM